MAHHRDPDSNPANFAHETLTYTPSANACRRRPILCTAEPKWANRASISQGRSQVAFPAMGPVIELEAVERRFGERPALAGITLSLEQGQTLVVFGPNGAGKTTLLRVLATLLRPHSGSATVLGASLPERGLASARPRRLPRPRPAALSRPERAREPCATRRACSRWTKRASTNCSRRWG